LKSIGFLFITRIIESNIQNMLTKNKVLKIIQKIPEQFTIEELKGRLVFVQNVENGLEESENEEIISSEELREKLNLLI